MVRKQYLKERGTVLGHQRIGIGFVLVVQRIQVEFLFLRKNVHVRMKQGRANTGVVAVVR